MNEDRAEHESSRTPDDWEECFRCGCRDEREFMRSKYYELYCDSCFEHMFE